MVLTNRSGFSDSVSATFCMLFVNVAFQWNNIHFGSFEAKICGNSKPHL